MESFFSVFGNFVVAIAPNGFELVVVAFLGKPSRLRGDTLFYFVANIGTKDVFSAVFVVAGCCLSFRPNMKLRKRKRKTYSHCVSALFKLNLQNHLCIACRAFHG